MKIKAGDIVKVITGSESIRGTVSKVVSVNRAEQRVILENGLLNKKHLKPERSRKRPEGGIIELPRSVHVSNVMLMSEASERPVRVGFTEIDGKKMRVAKGRGSSGERF